MFVSLSKKRIFLICTLLLAGLTIIAVADTLHLSGSSGMAIVATRLEEKPVVYFEVEDPDPYFLRAIANEGEPVFMGLFGDAEIDDLIALHNTGNVAYMDEFFVVGFLSVEVFGFGPNLLLATFVGWVAMIIFGLVSLFKRGVK